jgi:hypothetical protein
MWGEGASDLWGHLENLEDRREFGLLEAVRIRLAEDPAGPEEKLEGDAAAREAA